MSIFNKKNIKQKLTEDIDFVSIVEDSAPDKSDISNNKTNYLIYFCKSCKNILEKVSDVKK